MHDADYLIAFNLQRGAHGGGGSCCRAQARDRRDRLFSNEDVWPAQGDAPSNAWVPYGRQVYNIGSSQRISLITGP